MTPVPTADSVSHEFRKGDVIVTYPYGERDLDGTFRCDSVSLSFATAILVRDYLQSIDPQLVVAHEQYVAERAGKLRADALKLQAEADALMLTVQPTIHERIA